MDKDSTQPTGTSTVELNNHKSTSIPTVPATTTPTSSAVVTLNDPMSAFLALDRTLDANADKSSLSGVTPQPDDVDH